MQNVVSLQPDRPRPQRSSGVPHSGARILFFTGVRYCRTEDAAGASAGADRGGSDLTLRSDRPLDVAAH